MIWWQNESTKHYDLLVSHALVCMHVCTHNTHIHTKHIVKSSFFMFSKSIWKLNLHVNRSRPIFVHFVFIGIPWSSRRKGWYRRKGRKGDRSVINRCLIPQPSQFCCLYAINCPIKTYLWFYCVPKGRSQIHAKQNHEKPWKYMHRTSNINMSQSTACF